MIATVDWRALAWHEDGNCAGRESGANARLIAAAPELLAALNGLLAYFESGNSVPVSQATIKANSPEVLAARAAIARAGGEV